MSDTNYRRRATYRDGKEADGNIDREVIFKHPEMTSVYGRKQNSSAFSSTRSLDHDVHSELSTDFRKPIVFSVLQQHDMYNSGFKNHQQQLPHYYHHNTASTTDNKMTHFHEHQNKSFQGSDSMHWAPHKVYQQSQNVSTGNISSDNLNDRWRGEWNCIESQLLSTNANTRSSTRPENSSRSASDFHRSTDSVSIAHSAGLTETVDPITRRSDNYRNEINTQFTPPCDMLEYDQNYRGLISSYDEMSSHPLHQKHKTCTTKQKTKSRNNNSNSIHRKVQQNYRFHNHNYNSQHPTANEITVYDHYDYNDNSNHGRHNNTKDNSLHFSGNTPNPNPSSYNYNSRTPPERESLSKNVEDFISSNNQFKRMETCTTAHIYSSKLNGPSANEKFAMNSRKSKLSHSDRGVSKTSQTDIPDILPIQEHNGWNNAYASSKEGEMKVDAMLELRGKCDDKTRKRRRNHVIFLIVVLLIIAIAVVAAVLASTLGGHSPQSGPANFSVVHAKITLKILNRNFDVDLLTFGSDAFKNLAIPYSMELDELFLKSSLAHVYSKNEILSFRNGSIYATSLITFADKGVISSPQDVENVIETADVARDWKTLDAVQLGDFVVCRSCAETKIEYVTAKEQPDIMLYTMGSTSSVVIDTTTEKTSKPTSITSSTYSYFSSTANVIEMSTSDQQLASISTTLKTVKTKSTQSESITTTTKTTSLPIQESSATTGIMSSRKVELVTTTEISSTTTSDVKNTIQESVKTTPEVVTVTSTEGTSTTSSEATTTISPMTTTIEQMTDATTILEYPTTVTERRTTSTTAPTSSRTDVVINSTIATIETSNITLTQSPTVITVSNVSASSTEGSVTVTCLISNPSDWSAVNIMHTPSVNSNNGTDSTRAVVRLDTRDLYVVATISPLYNDRVRVVYDVSQSQIDIKLNISNLGCYDDGYIECTLADRTTSKTYGTGRLQVVERPSAPKLVIPVEVVANVEMTKPVTCQADLGFPAWGMKLTAQIPGAAAPHELLTEQDTLVNGCRTTLTLKQRPYTPTFASNGTIIRCELRRTDDSFEVGDTKVDMGVLLVVGGSVCKGKTNNTIIRHHYNCSSHITCLDQKPTVSSCPAGQCFDTMSRQCGLKAVIAESTNGLLNEGLAGITCSVIHVSDWSEIVIGREISLNKFVDILSVTSTGNVTWLDLSMSMRAIVNFRFNSLETVLEMWLYVLKCGDEGIYTCTARGPSSMKVARAELKVYAKPEAPKLVVPLTAVESNSKKISITCEANLGRPTATITLMRRLPNQMTFEPVNFTDKSPKKSSGCKSKIKRVHETVSSESLNGTTFRCDLHSSSKVDEKVNLSSEETQLYILPAKTCQGVGSTLLAHPKDCRNFVQCVQSETTVLSCGQGLCFNVNSQQCDILTPTSSPFMSGPCANDKSNVFKPHPLLCDKYFHCEAGRETIQHCPRGKLYSKDGSCSSIIHESFCFNSMFA